MNSPRIRMASGQARVRLTSTSFGATSTSASTDCLARQAGAVMAARLDRCTCFSSEVASHTTEGLASNASRSTKPCVTPAATGPFSEHNVTSVMRAPGAASES